MERGVPGGQEGGGGGGKEGGGRAGAAGRGRVFCGSCMLWHAPGVGGRREARSGSSLSLAGKGQAAGGRPKGAAGVWAGGASRLPCVLPARCAGEQTPDGPIPEWRITDIISQTDVVRFLYSLALLARLSVLGPRLRWGEAGRARGRAGRGGQGRQDCGRADHRCLCAATVEPLACFPWPPRSMPSLPCSFTHCCQKAHSLLRPLAPLPPPPQMHPRRSASCCPT